MKIIVDKSGEIKTINEALQLCKKYSDEKKKEIYIKNGLYKEKVIITQKNISLVGENRDKVIIYYDDCAYDKFSDGENLGTFRSSTVFSTGDYLRLKNLTMKNTGGDGEKVGQTVAFFSNGDLCKVVNCNFISNQDTLLLGPIPLDAKGARPYEYTSDIVEKRSYFYNCYIQGDVDFIFGGGSAVFEKCQLNSNNKNKLINGYVTAASTDQNNPVGFIFYKCKFTGSCEKSTVYIGRPWRKFARTVLISCELGEHIFPQVWSKWNDTDYHLTTFYGQYDCFGENYSKDNVAFWSYNLSVEEKEKYLQLVNRYKKNK